MRTGDGSAQKEWQTGWRDRSRDAGRVDESAGMRTGAWTGESAHMMAFGMADEHEGGLALREDGRQDV